MPYLLTIKYVPRRMIAPPMSCMIDSVSLRKSTARMVEKSGLMKKSVDESDGPMTSIDLYKKTMVMPKNIPLSNTYIPIDEKGLSDKMRAKRRRMGMPNRVRQKIIVLDECFIISFFANALEKPRNTAERTIKRSPGRNMICPSLLSRNTPKKEIMIATRSMRRKRSLIRKNAKMTVNKVAIFTKKPAFTADV